jgi:hypothetical protein
MAYVAEPHVSLNKLSPLRVVSASQPFGLFKKLKQFPEAFLVARQVKSV